MATNIFRRNQFSILKASSFLRTTESRALSQIASEFFENGVALDVKLADKTTSTDLISQKGVALTKTETITLAQSLINNYGISKSDAITLAESYIISRGIGKSIASTLSLSDSGGGGVTSFYKEVTVDKTKVANTDQTDFTVTISGTYAFLKTVSNGGKVEDSNGYDIGFYSDAGLTTKLPWRILRYIPTTGELIAQIKKTVTTATDTLFYMGYGNTAITTDQSNPTGAYDSNYLSVHNLEDGTTLSALDSTSNAHNGTLVNSPTAATGQIGGGAQFVNSSHQKISLGNYADNLSDFSVSILFNITSGTGNPSVLIGKLDNNHVYAARGWQICLWDVANGQIEAYVQTDSSNWIGKITPMLSAGGYDYIDNTWHHAAIRWNGSVFTLQVDGSTAGIVDDSGGTYTAHDNSEEVILGGSINGTCDFSGYLDEARISNSARTLDWYTTEANNLLSPSTFYSFGTEQSLSGGGGIVKDIGVNKADTITLTQALVKAIQLNLSDIINLADSANPVLTLFGLTINLSDTITLTDALIKDTAKKIDQLVNLADSTNKTIGLTKADILALGDIISKQPNVSISNAINLASVTSKDIGVSKADAITLTQALSKDLAKGLTNTITLTQALSKDIALNKSDSITLSMSLVKDMAKILSDTITLIDGINVQLTPSGALIINLSDTITLAQSLAKDVSYHIAHTIALIDAASKALSLTKSDTTTLSQSISKQIGKTQADIITLSETTAKAMQIAKADGLVLADGISKSFYRAVLDVVSLTDQNSKEFGRQIQDVILLGDIISKRTDLTVSDLVTLLDIINPYLSSKLGKLKRWDGNNWVLVKLWVAPNGTFIPAVLKVWDGSNWRVVDTSGI